MRKLHNDGRMIDVSDRLTALSARLEGEAGLAAVYLYGSYGTAYQTPLSDVDIAFVFRPHAVPDFDEHLRLIGVVTETLAEDDVSVTILNRAPLPFQHQVLRTGRILLVRDEEGLADFKEVVIDRFCDFVFDYEVMLRDYDAGLREAYGVRR
ncbi:MAG TPA: nucleotidyltransferase domain-containing protein [Candidatus Polarisedimenticolia bacterium]|nr:nucleotidyltransferase domain-containing protein [Candidatus Polarisedimenticolia bacterium]